MKKLPKLLTFIGILLILILGGIVALNSILKEHKKNTAIEEYKKNISEKITQSIYLNLPHRSTGISYADLGIRFNLDAAKNYFERCNNKCNYEYNQILNETSSELIVINDEKLTEFINTLNTEINPSDYSPYISFDNLTFKAYDQNANIVIDETKFKASLKEPSLLTNKAIQIETQINVGDLQAQKLETEKLINLATNSSLLIKYGRQPVYISSAKLKEFIKLETNENSIYQAKIDAALIKEYINTLKETYSLDIQLEDSKAVSSIAYALLFRVGGEAQNTAIILPIKGEPKTDGTYANKYLEINKSQQRMYAFENGELVNTYIIGTGLVAETPAGEFKILRKEGTAITYWGGWYMPFYMPIGTIDGKFFGFHEIPYRLDGAGQITSRDVNSMGSPATSGCIQLYREDAEQLYNWADIGTQVIIYE